jgi:IS5 family transposase
MEIGRAARGKTAPSRDKLKSAYGSLLRATSRVVGQAKRFCQEIGDGVKRCAKAAQQAVMDGHRRMLEMMVPRVQQVVAPDQGSHLQGRYPECR